jgi:hypothetical protein
MHYVTCQMQQRVEYFQQDPANVSFLCISSCHMCLVLFLSNVLHITNTFFG